jgi:hypothetical protein
MQNRLLFLTTLVALAALAFAAHAATVEVVGTGQKIPPAILQTLQPGDVLRLTGTFARSPLYANTVPVSVDATGATFNGLILQSPSSLTWTGGEFGPGLDATGKVVGKGLEVIDAKDTRLVGVHASRAGVYVRRGVGVVLDGLRIDYDGLGAEDVDNLTVTRFVINAAPANAISLVGVHGGVVSGGSILGNIRSGLVHPDAIQGWRSASGRDLEDIRISNNLIAAVAQAIYIKGGVAKRITITDNTIMLGDYKWCAGLWNVDTATLARNRCLSLPGGAGGANAFDLRGAVNVTLEGNSFNDVAGAVQLVK